jgi:hypothetical protein
MPTDHKTLTFPPKSEWPTFSAADWASDNRRYAFLRFMRRLISMFTTLDFVVGNDNYGGEWALLDDTAARKAHKTYPPPTSAPRRRVHRQTQLFLHRILLDIFSDHCPAIISDYLETSKYDDDDLQDDDGHPYCVGTALLQAIERHCVPTDDETSMTVMKRFETLLNSFPGIPSASDFGHLEKWANKTDEQWDRLSPYNDQLLPALPRFLQMLDHQLKSRKMANVDKIDWGDFKAYLNKNEQWLAKKDIPVYIAFSSCQLEALADAEGMTGTASSSKRAATAAFADSNDNNNSRRQRLEQWGAQVAASINGDSANPQGPKAPCIYCGRHHSLDRCRGVKNLIKNHQDRQLAQRGGISKPSLHRGSSWRTKKPSQFGARAYSGGGNGAADRGGRSGGGNGAAYRGRRGGGGNGAAGGNGHHGRRGSFPGRSFRDDSRQPSNRVGFSSHPTLRPHTNNVFVPEQGDDAAARQIVQANSASPHFVGAAITSAKGKELMESPPTVRRKQLAAESDNDLMITFTSSDDDDEHAKEEEYSDNDCGIFGPNSSSSDNNSTKHDDRRH